MVSKQKVLIISVLDAEEMARNKDLSNFDKWPNYYGKAMGQRISETASCCCGLLLVISVIIYQQRSEEGLSKKKNNNNGKGVFYTHLVRTFIPVMDPLLQTSVTCSFINPSNMQIWCSSNISSFFFIHVETVQVQVQVQVELYCHSATCGDIQWNECRASQDHSAT